MMRPIPFLARFSVPLETAAPTEQIRYERDRQVSQVNVAGRWIDAVDAKHLNLPATRVTKVDRETTDDQ